MKLLKWSVKHPQVKNENWPTVLFISCFITIHSRELSQVWFLTFSILTCKHTLMKITMFPFILALKAQKGIKQIEFSLSRQKKIGDPQVPDSSRKLLWREMGYGVVQTKLNFNQKTHCCSSEIVKKKRWTGREAREGDGWIKNKISTWDDLALKIQFCKVFSFLYVCH